MLDVLPFYALKRVLTLEQFKILHTCYLCVVAKKDVLSDPEFTQPA